MTRISMISALANNRCIGDNNAMPWRISADLKYFKAMTMGKPVIMGRKTLDSLGKPLVGRINIVISRTPGEDTDQIRYATSLDEAFEIGKALTDDEIMIVGGANIYSQALPHADRMYLTEVNYQRQNGELSVYTPAGDALFPEFSKAEWVVIQEDGPYEDEKSGLQYSYKIYDRAVA